MRNWTENQLDAIESRNGTVLVSAAAGSGKTAVLVERLIRRITDEKHPTDADKILVVTYTNAAASEMKERAEAAVSDLLLNDPNNKYFRKQQLLIPKMNISTVHSFCSKLCKEYFHVLDIARDFRILTDKQKIDLTTTALDFVIDERMDSGNFILSDAFSSDKNDAKLNEIILKLSDFINSHLDPKKWLADTLKMYTENKDICLTIWGETIIEYAKSIVELCIDISQNNVKIAHEEDVLKEKYAPTCETDIEMLQQLYDEFELNDWDNLKDILGNIKWKKFGMAKGCSDDLLKTRVSDSRKHVKELIAKVQKLFIDSSDEVREDITTTYTVIKELAEITLKYQATYTMLKNEKKFVDYSDLEHLTLKLLLDDRDGVKIPSEIALQISERYAEIMIDEYQDTNEVQDWIFRAVSKNDSNKFMVGDLKQCIYSFRQAMPEIFIGYKENFKRYDNKNQEYPAKVILDKNFRSRDSVINGINFVFDKLMSKKCGGVEYNDEEKLTLGADYPDGNGYEMQIDLLEKSDEKSQILEARHIANTINDLIKKGFMVKSESGLRTLKFSDCCILLRSVRSNAPIYAKELESMGVPAWIQETEGFFERKEILQIMSFLQVIDNPNNDIALLSVLMGPIYGFKPDDLAELRLNDRQSSIYVSLVNSNNDKFKTFLRDIEEYRLLSAHTQTEAFLDMLFVKTSFEALILAMDKGEERLGNVRKLRNYAAEFESSGFAGVSGFVRFTDNLKKNNEDLEAASKGTDKENVVKIMSIHKSKGLEFPVCFVANLASPKRPETDDVILNSKLGLGVKILDNNSGYKYTNIVREAVNIKNNLDEIEEELRILYVAMTRAKEKLIMVASYDNVEKTVTKIASYINNETKVKPSIVKNAPNMAAWLIMCALKHPNANNLRKLTGLDDSYICRDNYTPWEVNVVSKIDNIEAKTLEDSISICTNQELIERIQEKVNFVYPNAHLNEIPSKVTASAVVHNKENTVQSLNRPAFMSFSGLTPAERGIALHSYIEFCNLENASIDPEGERDRLVDNGYITKEQGEVVNFEKLIRFLESPLGTRIRKSVKLYREFRFTSNISASLVNDEFDSDINISLQGAVDCLFYENDKIYIVDFKTDRVESGEQLANLYGIQLKLYANALEKLKEVEVGGCYLYSFNLNKEIFIDHK